jgi:hypothetical protein
MLVTVGVTTFPERLKRFVATLKVVRAQGYRPPRIEDV